MSQPPREFNFEEQMAMSQGHSVNLNVEEILIENIPGAVKAFAAHETNDRTGTDWWVEHTSGQFLSVDCKVRESDWSAKPEPFRSDDLALETFSVIEQSIPGWTRNRNKKTHYVLWIWLDTGRWLLLPFAMLCAVYERKWQEWRTKYKTARQKTKRINGSEYHSECTFVPRKEVWAEIYRQYGGNLHTVHHAKR